MIYNIGFYFLLFLIYSFIGWCMEVLLILFQEKKFVNRGFLIGPLCPIYGVGCLLMIFLLNRYLNDPIVLFVMAMVVCSILEYFTSYIMEKLFKARWWDYSERKLNINGRICIEGALVFGILGLFMMYVANPFFQKVLLFASKDIIIIAAAILLVIFIVDISISLKVISGFKNIAKTINKDNTEEITKKVREILSKRGGLYKRLVSAFSFEISPKIINSLKHGANKAKKILEKEKLKREEEKQKIITEYMNTKRKLKNRIKEEKKKLTEKLKNIK